MFSPYYKRARDRGGADPLDHCAFNIALYGRGGGWAMTERGRRAVSRSRRVLSIGRSALHWDGQVLTVTIDETTVPWPSRIRGTVRVVPAAISDHSLALDAAGQHRWQAIAPRARVEVALDSPAINWSGTGYCDTNDGDAPLENAFESWHWSRASLRDGTVVLYDVRSRAGEQRSHALLYDPAGNVRTFAPPPRAVLPASGWRIARETRADAGHDAKVLRTLTDAPFYARSLVASRLLGEPVTAVHESLSLDRFRVPWVRMLLPFRMPRVNNAGHTP